MNGEETVLVPMARLVRLEAEVGELKDQVARLIEVLVEPDETPEEARDEVAEGFARYREKVRKKEAEA